MLRSGATFLTDLHRRALADARLQLVESSFIAALAGAWLGLSVRETDWGAELYVSRATLWLALGAAAVWCAAALALMRWAREAQRQYIAQLLTESGLLYLALEHEPAELLAALKRRETLGRLKPAGALALSFSARMLALLQTYPACAAALGYQAWPRLQRYLERGAGLASLATVLWLLYLLAAPVMLALAGDFNYPPALRPLGALAVLLILLSFTLAHARKTGLWLALVDVLHGPVSRERALLTRS